MSNLKEPHLFEWEPSVSSNENLLQPTEMEIEEKRKKIARELENENWFVGFIDAKGAEALFEKCTENSFLIRFSTSKKDCFVLSIFDFQKNKVAHSLISPVKEIKSTYYQVQGNPRIYPSIKDIAENCPNLRGYKAWNASVETTPTEFITQNISLIELLVDEALKGKKTFQEICTLKNQIKSSITEHEVTLQELDKRLIMKSIENSSSVMLSDEENAQYIDSVKQVQQLKKNLLNLRLRESEFKIIHKGHDKKFRIDSESQITFCHVSRTINPEECVPNDMSRFAYFNVGVVDGKDGTIYEITSASIVHHIDQVKCIVPEDTASQRGGGCCIYWKNGKKSSFCLAIPGEKDELIQVVEAHLLKYKHSTKKQLEILKDIIICKKQKVNPISEPEHRHLLIQLWNILSPGEKLSYPSNNLKSNQWREIGFQGNDPSTDFRGMGLLGLLNLFYFASHYSERARHLVLKSKQNANSYYPWAVAGINITNMLLNMLHLNSGLLSLSCSLKFLDNPDLKSLSEHPLLSLFYYADDEDTFDELYSQSFLLFDQLWNHMNAGYMDFPQVISRLQQHIEDLLKKKPKNINQLIAWIEL